MSIFEYLFERRNPSNVGNIERNNQSPKNVTMPVLIFKWFISIGMMYGLFYITVRQNFSAVNMLLYIIILFGYCSLSYKFIPKPDTSNIGLFGGMFDHPFRYTDDINRVLIILLVLMYPGRFITITIIQIIMKFKKSN
jgi:hypothetical protein